ncbi:MAG: response regulator [Bacteroidales bacterium]|nr:response regulator [Bacteroidales bacterium]
MEKKILVVDDSESIREILKSLLEEENFLVEVAEDGLKGLDKVKSNDYDLILTDLHMPNLDGIGFINEARKLENCKRTPILFLTTETQQEAKDKAKEAGATGWIIKPFVPAKIKSIVNRVLH